MALDALDGGGGLRASGRLTGLEDVKPHKGESYRVRTLEVYVLHNGRWQMAAHQSARVRQP